MEVAVTCGEGRLYMKKLGTRIGGALLTLAFVLGISAATGATAQAQYRNDDGQYRRQSDRDYEKDQKRKWKQRRRDNRNNGRYGNNGNYGRNDGYGSNGNYGRNDGYGSNGNYGRND